MLNASKRILFIALGASLPVGLIHCHVRASEHEEVATGFLNQGATQMGGASWALWLPELLEEGCHSAGFTTTIHDGHHLLLS